MEVSYTVTDIFDLNILLNFPTNSKLISDEFKTIPGCNKSYGFHKSTKQNNIDNIKSILNKIHTSTFDKLYTKLLVIINSDKIQITNFVNIIKEYLDKTAMLDNSLDCYAQIFANLYNNKTLSYEFIVDFIKKIYYKQCYNNYNITPDVSNISVNLLPLLTKLHIIPENNIITCDAMVNIASYLNTIMKINIKFISLLQKYIFKEDLKILIIIIDSFINNSIINNYNLISLNSLLTNNTLTKYIKNNYYHKIYNIYDNLDNYVSQNGYDYNICEAELEKLTYKLCKVH